MRHFKLLTFISRPGPGVQWCALAIFALLSLSATASVMAATPLAGSIIGNQAIANYTDASGQTQTTTSNLVETTVLQVGSLTLVTDNTKTAAVGNTVYMPHTLTNTGNGNDSFVLSTSDFGAEDSDFATVNIFLDANSDGVPDGTVPLATGLGSTFTTPSLPPGGTYDFVVAMTVPSGSTGADQITVTATGSTLALYDGNGNGTFGETGDNVKTNTDTLTVTAAAAFQVTKGISATQGPTGVTLTYTLAFTNVGSTAGNLALYDVIGSGATAGYKYVAGSGRWSAGGDTVLTDASGNAQTSGDMTARYSVSTTGSDPDTVTNISATIADIGANTTSSISFQVLVENTAVVGVSTTTNTAMYGIDATPGDETDNSTDATFQTNLSYYNVLPGYSVVLNDGTNASGVPTDGVNTRPVNTDTDSPDNPDLLYEAAATLGQPIFFPNVVWNTGTTTDTFNITATQAPASSWPVGTSYQLLRTATGAPLLDTNGDGIPDTGPLAPGESLTVFMKITLPLSACSGGCPSGPFDFEKKATSVGDITKTNTTYDRVGSLKEPTVDLANSAGTADPNVNQDAIGAAATKSYSVQPGKSVVIPLFVRNEGGIPDTYALTYSGSTAFSPTTNLPAGWTLQFHADISGAKNCSIIGSTISNVGPVAAGAETTVCAVVTVPADSLPGETSVYFQIKSAATGAYDRKWDAVDVNLVPSISVAPNNVGQIYAGGTVVYSQAMTNSGNTTCTADPNTVTFTTTQSLASQGWTFVMYIDVNGNGQIDAGDIPLSGPTMTYQDGDDNLFTPGETFKGLVKVFAPAGAAAGSVDVVSWYLTDGCGTISNTITNTTTVLTGQVRLEKTQALDADCDGTADVLYTTNKLNAKPGECIMYQVTATNQGNGDINNLTIEDSLPAYTDQYPVATGTPNPACTMGTAAYAAPTFSCSGITLTPASSATATFSVKVRQ
ncbi:MAG: DUF11 domain-containing protein [Desulfuromonadaceae bacterium]|nr:DUF11 domain-containing protein [Desulfuromonadaceae bacterium]